LKKVAVFEFFLRINSLLKKISDSLFFSSPTDQNQNYLSVNITNLLECYWIPKFLQTFLKVREAEKNHQFLQEKKILLASSTPAQNFVFTFTFSFVNSTTICSPSALPFLSNHNIR